MTDKRFVQERRLKVALFGYGKMGLHHARAIELQNCARLIAISDPLADHQKLHTLLPKDVEIFSNTEDLLKKLRPDVVHICTPPHTHVSLAKVALQYGANIYVEKPFALKTSEAESVISLANEMGLKVCAGHQVLFENPGRKTQEFLREIGRIVHIESYFSFRTVRRSISPVNQLIDILPHPVYLLLHFLQAVSNHPKETPAELSVVDVRSNGEIRGILRAGGISGVLIVTLRGRPIESYLRIVGTNGSLYADFVRGSVTKLLGPGSSIVSIVLNPYSQAKQIFVGTTKALAGRVFWRKKGYPGLSELMEGFYKSVLNNTEPPLTTASILQTVSICEVIGEKLKEAEAESEKLAEAALKQLELKLPPIDTAKRQVLVTGGTGFLGRVVVSELRNNGWHVCIIARHIPPLSAQIPGVEYVAADLGEEVSVELLKGIDTIIHCAAETAGGKEAHERNTVLATQNILNAAAKAGVTKFIHVSSAAVLKTSREMRGPIDESTPLDLDNLSRGPYVWGKAQSEKLALELGEKLDIAVRVIRLGPLVDFESFEAPGRLGRELGSFFLAVGSQGSRLSLCEVHTAAEVIWSYVSDFDTAPPVLNLVEPNAPTRAELVARLLKERPDLKALWIPVPALKVISLLAKILMRFILPGKKPIDLRAAFSSERYKTDLASAVIKKARQPS